MMEYFSIDAPLYQTVRFNHHKCSTGKSDALIVTRHPTHWKFICHRCGWQGEKPIDNLTPAQVTKLASMPKDKVVQHIPDIKLPDDFTNIIPDNGLIWFYDCGLLDEEIARFKFGFSKTYNRIILPVYLKGKLIYWQGRYLETPDKYNSKYINIFGKDRADTYFSVRDICGPSVVLVEDILSCVKVGRYADCISLLGSYIPDKLIQMCIKQGGYTTIYVWLDNDKAVQSSRYVQRFQTMFTGVDVKMVFTGKDPKYYNEVEIKGRIYCGS